MVTRILMAGGVLVLAVTATAAAIVEEVVTVAVEVVDRNRTTVKQPITVTVFRDDARAKAPFLILNHGRAGTPEEREKLGRARFPGNAAYFVARGFAVFVPTRIGYGISGGPDVENTGRCSERVFAPGFEAAAQQTLAVIRHAKAQAYVTADKGLVVGQSFGGATAIAVAAKNEPGVVATINFSGGSGGRPKAHPGMPCSGERMAAVLAGYGKTASVPTAWLYSGNDKYWGEALPRQWFEGFVKNGGRGRFIALPPHGEDGHASFSRNRDGWKAAVEAFLRDIGMAAK